MGADSKGHPLWNTVHKQHQVRTGKWEINTASRWAQAKKAIQKSIRWAQAKNKKIKKSMQLRPVGTGWGQMQISTSLLLSLSPKNKNINFQSLYRLSYL